MFACSHAFVDGWVRFEGQEKKEKRGVESAKRKQKRPKHPIRAVLSFGDEEEEAVTEGPDSKVSKKKESDRKERRTSKYGKCPSVETEFLPDAYVHPISSHLQRRIYRERDRREKELREQLKRVRPRLRCHTIDIVLNRNGRRGRRR